MTENLNKKPPKGILKSSSSFDTASCGSSASAPGVRRNSGVGTNSLCGDVGGHAVGCSRQSSNELTVEGVGGGGECCGGDNGEEYVHVRKHSKTAKFDEMNILETYHPATKTYGHMKIEEPKTPFNYYEDEEDGGAGGGESSSQAAAKRRSKEIDADELLQKLNECKGNEDEGAVGGEVEEEEPSSSEEDEDEDPENKALRVKFESKRKAHYNEYYAVKLARKLMEQEEDEDEDEEKETTAVEQEEEAPGAAAVVEGDIADRMVTD